jgi:hypothetical protein
MSVSDKMQGQGELEDLFKDGEFVKRLMESPEAQREGLLIAEGRRRGIKIDSVKSHELNAGSGSESGTLTNEQLESVVGGFSVILTFNVKVGNTVYAVSAGVDTSKSSIVTGSVTGIACEPES